VSAQKSFGVIAALLVFAGGCINHPKIDAGSLKCKTDDNCPSGYQCFGATPTVLGVCARSAPDGAVTDVPVGGELGGKTDGIFADGALGEAGGAIDGVTGAELGTDSSVDDASVPVADDAGDDGARLVDDAAKDAGGDVPITGNGGASGGGGTSGGGGIVGSGGTSTAVSASGGAGGTAAGGIVGGGGVVQTGGVVGTGGIVGTGGTAGTAGMVGAGGTTGTGGTAATGGIVGTGGAGTGGVAGTGGISSTGGAGTGGVVATGGVAGTGGATGTGGTGGATGTADYGAVCSTAADCPSDATCCNGSVQSCDATRLPSGDGTNSGEFVVSSDGLTVTDTITGLVWQRDGSGTRAGCTSDSSALTCTWAEAKAYCASLALGGLTGWRVPGLAELSTIADFTETGPAIDQTVFPSTPPAGQFWTSSPYVGSSGYAWSVSASDGYSEFKDASSNFRVRCVR
jgi:hypothetical protein